MTTRQPATPAPNDVVDLTIDESDVFSTDSEDSDSPPPQPSRSSSIRRLSRPARVAAWRQEAHAQERREQADHEERLAQIAREQQGAGAIERQPTHSRVPPISFASGLRGGQMDQQQHPQPLAPPFDQRAPLVIVLSDEEDSDLGYGDFDIPSDEETNDSDSIASIESPEVQFLEERHIPQPERPPAQIAADVAQMDRGPGPFALNIPDLLRRGTEIVFGNMQNTLRNYNEGFLDRLDGVPRRNQMNEGGAMAVNMDYGRAAFAMGFDPFDRNSETPQVVQEPYKGPSEPRDGFIRTFKEEDIILCPMCGDELAIGKGDVKQQVWVSKACGHVSHSFPSMM